MAFEGGECLAGMLGRSDREQGVLIIEVSETRRRPQGRFQGHAGQENRVLMGGIDRVCDIGLEAPEDDLLPVAAKHLGNSRAPGAAANYAYPVEVCRHAPTLGHVGKRGKRPAARSAPNGGQVAQPVPQNCIQTAGMKPEYVPFSGRPADSSGAVPPQLRTTMKIILIAIANHSHLC